jgi:hypothetical protein
VLDHQVQQPQRPLPIQQEVLVHDEERPDVQGLLELTHDLKELVARLVEMNELALPAEHGGGCAEVAPQRAPDGRNQDGGHVTRPGPQGHARGARAETRENLGMADRLALVFGQKAAHPAHTLAAHDVVGVDPLIQAGQVRDMAADDNRGPGEMLTDQRAHLAHLVHVGHDGADADDVVVVRRDLLEEAIQAGKIQQGAPGADIGLDQHEPPGAVEHPHGERPLHAGDLVVVQLHGIDRPAAVLVVLGCRRGGRHRCSLGSRVQYTRTPCSARRKKPADEGSPTG